MQTTATSDTTGGTGGTSIALTHLQPQNFTTPPLSCSAPVWNLKGDIAEAATAIGGNSPDTSSSSSKYNETWPSRSELASNEGQEHTVGVVEGQKVGVAEDEDNSEGSAAVEGSTLAQLVMMLSVTVMTITDSVIVAILSGSERHRPLRGAAETDPTRSHSGGKSQT